MKRSRGNKFADVFYGVRKALGVLLLCVGIMGVLTYAAAQYILQVGENSLRGETVGKVPIIAADFEQGDGECGQDDRAEPGKEDSSYVWKEGWVRYNGVVYEYKENMLTFLMLGIDKEGKAVAGRNETDGGQADAIFLVAADPDTRKISLIAVNRDTMVELLLEGLGEDGEDVVYEAQLAAQHGFGDGLQRSCELTRDRVSELFYGLPIHGYASLNMGGIAALNDALGGVEVTVLEDMTKKNGAWKQGARITLKGKDAFWYVRWRDTSVFESNRGRLERQKQYLKAFAQKAVEAVKKDVTTPVRLYNALKDYIVTDLSADEIAYLASKLVGYSFEGEIYTLEGKTEMKGEHEAFYPDKEALKELLIEVFYREAA